MKAMFSLSFMFILFCCGIVLKMKHILSYLVGLEVMSVYFFIFYVSNMIFFVDFMFFLFLLVMLILGSVMGISSYVSFTSFSSKDYALVLSVSKF